MDKQITARNFLENTFTLDFLSPEEKETIEKAMELYARGRNRQLTEALKDLVKEAKYADPTYQDKWNLSASIERAEVAIANELN